MIMKWCYRAPWSNRKWSHSAPQTSVDREVVSVDSDSEPPANLQKASGAEELADEREGEDSSAEEQADETEREDSVSQEHADDGGGRRQRC